MAGTSVFPNHSDSGTRIITDPYETGGDLSYDEIRDIVVFEPE